MKLTKNPASRNHLNSITHLRLWGLGILLMFSTVVSAQAQSTQPASSNVSRAGAEQALQDFARLMDDADASAADRLVSPELEAREKYTDFLLALAKFQAETSLLRQAVIKKFGQEPVDKSNMFQSALPEAGLASLIEKGQWVQSKEGWVVMIPHGARRIQVPLKSVKGKWYLKAEQMTAPLGGVSSAAALFEMMASVMKAGHPMLEQHETLIDFHKALNALTMQRMSAFQAQAMERINEEKRQRGERFLIEFPLKAQQNPKPAATLDKTLSEIQQAFKLGQAQQLMRLFKAESIEAKKTRVFYGVLVTLAWEYDKLRLAVKDKWGEHALKQLDKWDTMAGRTHTFRDQLNQAKMIREPRAKGSTQRAYVVGPANEPLLILMKTDPEGWFINGEALSSGLQHVEVEMAMLYKLSVVYGVMAQAARGDQFKSFDEYFITLKMRSTEAIAPHVAELARLRRGNSESKP